MNNFKIGAIFEVKEEIKINNITINKGNEFLINSINIKDFKITVFEDADFNDGVEILMSRKHIDDFKENKIEFIQFY